MEVCDILFNNIAHFRNIEKQYNARIEKIKQKHNNTKVKLKTAFYEKKCLQNSNDQLQRENIALWKVINKFIKNKNKKATFEKNKQPIDSDYLTTEDSQSEGEVVTQTDKQITRNDDILVDRQDSIDDLLENLSEDQLKQLEGMSMKHVEESGEKENVEESGEKENVEESGEEEVEVEESGEEEEVEVEESGEEEVEVEESGEEDSEEDPEEDS